MTYRCNNSCLHCWTQVPPSAEKKNKELSFNEFKEIIEEAKSMGCHQWSISGGEPMLRGDFLELFDYMTRNSTSYSINTNGNFITPKIARLMRRKGRKMVVLYGSTAAVHDHITRNPGSFEAALRGIGYLKEAGAGFIVQLVLMKDNHHDFGNMVRLAQSLSQNYRVGAPWLFLSACGNRQVNCRIKRQRLKPQEVIALDEPDLSYEDWMHEHYKELLRRPAKEEYLFSACIKNRQEFHIDPYGGMTFCNFIKASYMRYDLRKGNFKEGWEVFIPSLAKGIKVNKEYQENCGNCALRKDCRWCAVYGYLEHRRFSARVEYLCAIARENRKFKDGWLKSHRRYYKIAGITVQVDSDLSILENTFDHKFRLFEVNGPSEDVVSIRHHFSLPELNPKDLGKELYRFAPWVIYRKDNSWIYLTVSSGKPSKKSLCQVAVFNHDHSRARIYHNTDKTFLKGGLHSLTLLPTDQLFLSQILADRGGFILHSCGIKFDAKGLLFVGHSGAGKSTIARLLEDKSEILCDDRIIVREGPGGFKIYGTWNHGDVSTISPKSAPLRAILFLDKAKENLLLPIEDKGDIARNILACVVRALPTSSWWEKTLLLVDKVAQEIPCYILKFDKSGKIADRLRGL